MSELRADQIANRAGTGPVGLVGQSAAKVFFVCDAASAVRKSFNVSSTTFNANSDTTVSFTNAYADVNYQWNFGCTIAADNGLNNVGHNARAAGRNTNLTTSVRLFYARHGTSWSPGASNEPIGVLFGDLA